MEQVKAEPVACPMCKSSVVREQVVCRSCLGEKTIIDDGSVITCPLCHGIGHTHRYRANPQPAAVDGLVEIAKRILDCGYISQFIEEERDDYEALTQALAQIERTEDDKG